MKIKDFKCSCGHDDFFFGRTLKKGIYCAYCGKWFKWANKDEQNLDMKQESILDKIRAEIDCQDKWLLQAGYTAYNVDIAFDAIRSVLAESEDKE